LQNEIVQTPITSYQSDQNNLILFESNQTLRLAFIQNRCNTYVYHLMTNISIDIDKYTPYQLNCAQLDLPIAKYNSNFRYIQNSILIKACQLIENKLEEINTIGPVCIPITNYSFSNHALQLDITELLRQLHTNRISSCILSMELTQPGLSILVHDCKMFKPQLYLQYSTSEITPIAPVTPVTVPASALHVVSDAFPGKVLKNNEIMPFNKVIVCSKPYISFDLETYKFSIRDTGLYYANWVINLQGCCGKAEISMGVRNESTDEVYEFFSPCFMPCQIFGQYVFEVKQQNTFFDLINHSGGRLQLANTPAQGEFSIFKIK